MAHVSTGLIGASKGGLASDGSRTYTLVYRTIVDSPDDGAILAISNVPFDYGDPYLISTEGDAGAVVNNIDTEQQDDDGLTWITTVTFGKRNSKFGSNPVNLPARVSGSFQMLTKSIIYDINNVPIENSAGVPYDESEIDDPQPLLVVRKNYSTWNPLLAYLYRNAVNSDPYRGAAPGTVKVMAITWEEVDDNDGGVYYAVTFSFAMKPEGWDLILLDAGTEYIDGNGVKRNIVIGGQKVTDPVKLDGAGGILPDGDPPVFNTFQVYPRLSFSVFP